MAIEAALDKMAGAGRPLGLSGVGSRGMAVADSWKACHSSSPEMPLLEHFPDLAFPLSLLLLPSSSKSPSYSTSFSLSPLSLTNAPKFRPSSLLLWAAADNSVTSCSHIILISSF